MKINFLNYFLFGGSLSTCAEEIADAATCITRDCKILACFNPHSYVVACKDVIFRHALENVEWLVPDGIGIVIASRWLGLPIKKRITGPDLFEETMRLMNDRKGSVFFLGANSVTLEKIKAQMTKVYPDVILAGTYAPPFKAKFSEEDNLLMIAAVNDVKPDLLWVGITAPKQEKWLAENKSKLEVGAAGAIGAAFDFFAGTLQRSPKLFCFVGLEWLPRLIKQPRKLWRRMVLSGPLFIFDVYKSRRSTLQNKYFTKDI